MKSLFRMGIPVVGKNYFPSNIQGLPTWYEIRVSGEGYIARAGRIDIMVAMNAETYDQDVQDVSPGGYLVYDDVGPDEPAGLDFALSLKNGYFEIAKCVRFKRLDPKRSLRHLVAYDIHTGMLLSAQAFEIDIAVD